MLGAAAINLLSLGLPLVMLQIFDRVIPFQALETLAVLIIGLLVALALDYVLKCCRIVVMAHAAERFEVDLNDRAAAVVLNAEATDYADHKAVDRFEEISAVAQLRDHYGGQGRLLVIDLPFVAVFVGLIWFVGGWLVAVPITCFLLLAGLSFVLRRFHFFLLQLLVLNSLSSIVFKRSISCCEMSYPLISRIFWAIVSSSIDHSSGLEKIANSSSLSRSAK